MILGGQLMIKIRHIGAYLAAIFLASLVANFVSDARRELGLGSSGWAAALFTVTELVVWVLVTAWLYSRFAPLPHAAEPKRTREDVPAE